MVSYVIVFQTDRPDEVGAIRRALDEGRISYRSSLLASQPPRMVFTVPEQQAADARRVIGTCLAALVAARGDEDELDEPVPESATGFPRRQVLTAGGFLLAHVVLVLVGRAWPEVGRRMVEAGALVGGGTLGEPWRLLTYIFLHADLAHALWNGLSMIVFAVPLLLRVGDARTLAIYLVAGAGGGISAATFVAPGRLVIGSSGAVAGLYGAWILLALRDARKQTLTLRAKIRIIGIALLVLPSLLSPVTASGRPISVSGHLGGMATGMLIGALLGARTATLGGPGRLAPAGTEPAEPIH